METKEVILYVRKGFEIPDIGRLSDDPLYCEEVLKNGVSVVSRKKDVEFQHLLDQRYDELVSSYEEKLKSVKAKCEKVQALCEEKGKVIECRDREIEQIQQHILGYMEKGRQAGREEMDRFVESYKTQLEERKEELNKKSEETDKLASKIDQLMEEIGHVRNIFKKSGGRKPMTATAIGKLGEGFVNNWIREVFNPAVTKITDSDSESADLRMKYEGVDILIEAKNKGALKPADDLEKFHRDIKKYADEPTELLKAAILVNLQDSTLIHGWKICYFETRNNMPVLYVGGIQERPVLFTAAIYLLCRLAKSGQYGNNDVSSSEDEAMCEREAHKETAIKHLLFIHHMNEELIKDKKAHEEQGGRLLSRERTIKEFAEYKADLFDMIPGVEESFRTALRPTVGGDKRVDERSQETLLNEAIQLLLENQEGGKFPTEPALLKLLGGSKYTRHKLKRDTGHSYTQLKDKASRMQLVDKPVDRKAKTTSKKDADDDDVKLANLASLIMRRKSTVLDSDSSDDEIDNFLKS